MDRWENIKDNFWYIMISQYMFLAIALFTASQCHIPSFNFLTTVCCKDSFISAKSL